MSSTEPFLRLENLRPGDLPPTALAVGVFDGVHRGHRRLLEVACTAVAAEGAGGAAIVPAALTFDPHPAVVFAPGRVPPMLGTLTERAALLHAAGAELVVVARFDRNLAAQTPDEFVERTLVTTLRTHTVVVGEDFRFGCDRTGDVRFLRRAGDHYGFSARAIAPVFVNGVPARSTGIRHMIAGGEIEEATRLLGRPYSLSGEVVHGKQLGRTIGFPTANVVPRPEILVPCSGVYAGRVRLADGIAFRAAISIGSNITIAPDAAPTIEAYLMDGFSGDLYGQRIVVEFVSRLRAMERFASVDALVDQMMHDVREAAVRLV
jgi:riboflavin kinase/FMN adenylyltransferase